jgi:hypothetical protein
MCKNNPVNRLRQSLICFASFLSVVFGVSGCAGVVASKSQQPSLLRPLQIVTTSLPAATMSQSYNTTLKAAGGIPPYSWNVSATSQLPGGISLNAQTGTLSGAATVAGTFNVTVGLKDSAKVPDSASVNLTLQVTSSGSQPLQITVASLPAATASQAYSAQLTASGGSGALHWSILAGQLPSGISLNTLSGALSGTTTQTGSFAFTAQVQDSSSTPQVATKALTLTADAPTPPPGNASPTYYGSGIGADALCNIQLGGTYGYQASYRFRASHTGQIKAVHFYLIVDKTGYSSGNGGEVQVNLETDDGTSAHNPSGSVLATYTITNPQQAGASGNVNFPIITFSSPASVTQGNLYHLVFSNPSTSSAVDFVSLDDLWHATPSNPVQPTEDPTDFAVLEMPAGQPWALVDTHTPILQTDYTDGTAAGNGYIEVWGNVPQPIGGTNAVRETFQNSGSNLAVTSVSFRLARVSGTAPLTVRLEQADGTLIEQGTIPSSSLPVTTTPTYVWVTYSFSAVRTLFGGQGYHVVLEAASGTTYQAYPIRKGDVGGFANTTYFPDGYAECNTNGTWTGWTEWGTPNLTDGDLQFYFTVTP